MNAYHLTNRELMPYHIGSGIFEVAANREGLGSTCSTHSETLHEDCGDEDIFEAFGETPVSFDELALDEAWENALQRNYEELHEKWSEAFNEEHIKQEGPSNEISALKSWLDHDAGEPGVTEAEVMKAEEELEELEEKLETLQEELEYWLKENPETRCNGDYWLPLGVRIAIIESALMRELETSHAEWLEAVPEDSGEEQCNESVI